MKKRSLVVILLILAVVLTLSLTACNSIFVNSADPTRYYFDIGSGNVDDLRIASIVANNTIASCVRIISQFKNGAGSALSGFVITEDGYVLTNRHGVIMYSSTKNDIPGNISEQPMDADYSVVFADNIEYSAKLIAYSSLVDLAVLKIMQPLGSSLKFQPLVLETERDVYYGERVYTIGNPENIGLILTELMIASPAMQLNQYDSFKSIIIDGNINHGNSGGPILNVYSRVCGIAYAKIGKDGDGTYGIGCAMPTETIVAFLNSIKHAKINYKTTPASTGSGEVA